MRTLEEQNCDVDSVDAPAFSRDSREGMKAFDFTCRHYLKMSGKQFLDLYKAGKFERSTETGVQRAIAMLPFAR